MPRRHAACSLLSVALALAAAPARAQENPYLTPPPDIAAAIDASVLPKAVASPSGQVVAILRQNTMPSIAEMAAPLLRLAGQRINPDTNGLHFNYRSPTIAGITLTRVADGVATDVPLPKGPAFSAFRFAPDGRSIALMRAGRGALELWLVDVASGKPRKLVDASLNGAWGDACEWVSDSRSLLCRMVSPTRGAAPVADPTPTGPKVQQNTASAAPMWTSTDLLTSRFDDRLFEYYFTSQLAFVDASTGAVTPVGAPGLFDSASPSPDGKFVLVNRLKAPYSRLVGATAFAASIEVIDRAGRVVRALGEAPLGETTPINGVRVGPRLAAWTESAPAVVAWVEALDEGRPDRPAARRDRVLTLAAPFEAAPATLIETEYRTQSFVFSEKGVAFVTEYDRGKRWTRTWLVAPGGAPEKLFDRSAEDRYGDPGTLVRRPAGVPTAPFGQSPDKVVMQVGDVVYLAGEGASPQGDRPFLDRFDLKTKKSERLYRSPDGAYAPLLAVTADDGGAFVTVSETPKSPPNVIAHRGGATKALTAFTDAVPQLAAAEKRLLTYARKDGVKLSAILYLPQGRKPDERLPMVLWAYPREFIGADSASQVVGSPFRYNVVDFATLYMSLLFRGYAVLVPAMPIVGAGETANDTYVDQLVANAQASVDAAAATGAIDPKRVGVSGHSYGAFMTANLLAHSDIFRAGVALSGAYNRSLTPFGFQNERRTFWQAPALYAGMSPFWFADKIKEPILLTHGEVDNNQGTFPIQTERFYLALKGHGATVRYVVLPNESHRYAARETLFHVAAESLAWFDRYVKGAGAPSEGPKTSAAR